MQIITQFYKLCLICNDIYGCYSADKIDRKCINCSYKETCRAHSFDLGKKSQAICKNSPCKKETWLECKECEKHSQCENLLKARLQEIDVSHGYCGPRCMIKDQSVSEFFKESEIETLFEVN